MSDHKGPRMQNIPVRTEEGRRIRQLFHRQQPVLNYPIQGAVADFATQESAKKFGLRFRDRDNPHPAFLRWWCRERLGWSNAKFRRAGLREAKRLYRARTIKLRRFMGMAHDCIEMVIPSAENVQALSDRWKSGGRYETFSAGCKVEEPPRCSMCDAGIPSKPLFAAELPRRTNALFRINARTEPPYPSFDEKPIQPQFEVKTSFTKNRNRYDIQSMFYCGVPFDRLEAELKDVKLADNPWPKGEE